MTTLGVNSLVSIQGLVMTLSCMNQAKRLDAHNNNNNTTLALDVLTHTSLSLGLAASTSINDLLIALSDTLATAHSLESIKSTQTVLLERLTAASLSGRSLATSLEQRERHESASAARMVSKWSQNKNMLESKRIDYMTRLDEMQDISDTVHNLIPNDLQVLDNQTQLAAQKTNTMAHRLESLQHLPPDILLAQLKLDQLKEKVRQRNLVRHELMTAALIANTSVPGSSN
ncbi:hypothetical protein BATDEDRAFT_91196 [Batrachochytrium dendrobatidis JAM81]|uniref:HAUS augmin-like complex subunit 1 n=2 Tax=Batrachochytrium dendrobatidis TaxID=109871 RepID=F4PA96_BATDJ|nr:uncharacterized protein BATDEDRAFT_91196 [Batrachochytrium dendrobatidis JAM81]EGF78027.1 hypothetical protein BATDEDRAFT_91196 [Batrachochytrium dendrobatidis JAM81]|eukprot:XP_006681551.1 hypothetical protein BATDEDRAFT_91196 [Batrachochytrium dendrobatidis JAM81]